MNIEGISPSHWYRVRFSVFDGKVYEYCEALPVLSVTSKCVKLWDGMKGIYVKRDARKRYAYPTRQEARESALIRTDRYQAILEARYDQCVLVKDAVKRGAEEKREPWVIGATQ